MVDTKAGHAAKLPLPREGTAGTARWLARTALASSRRMPSRGMFGIRRRLTGVHWGEARDLWNGKPAQSSLHASEEATTLAIRLVAIALAEGTQ
jgi:hypothetical protein